MSLESPLVSIIVSAYQGIQYLPATLNSILQQTYTKFEVLVFSNDYSHAVSWFRLQQDERFKFFFPDNLGLAQTLNQGILQAMGKYVSWIDAGDIWHPTKLQKQLFCLERFPDLDFVYSWLLLIDHQGQSTGEILKPEYVVEINLPITEPNPGYPKSLMLHRRCFETIGLFDSKLEAIPDWDMWLRLNLSCQFMQIAEPLVYWRQNQSPFVGNWQILEIDLQTTIEKTCLNSAVDLSFNKCRSYGYASLFLARTVLANKDADLAIAQNYCQQALAHFPAIGLSLGFMRIQLAIITLSYRRSDRFWLTLLRKTIFLFRQTSRLLREYSYRLLDWMLKEEDIIIWSKNSKVKRQGKE